MKYLDIESDIRRDKLVAVCIDGQVYERRKVGDEALRALFESIKDEVIVAHYAKFDVKQIYREFGVLFTKVWDTWAAAKILRNGMKNKDGSPVSNALVDVLYYFLGKRSEIHSDKATLQKGFSIMRDLTPREVEYIKADVADLPELQRVLSEKLEADGLSTVMRMEMALLPVVIKKEVSGVRIDIPKLHDLVKVWRRGKRIAVGMLDREIERLSQSRPSQKPTMFVTYGYSSTKQISQIFKDFGLPVPFKKERNKAGTIIYKESNDEDVLTEYVYEHPDSPMRRFIELYLWFKEIDKLISTYGEKMIEQVDANGYIHSEYNPLGAETGRLSSKNPNCFDGDTEVLTKQGWVPFKHAVISKPEVAQWEEGKITFVQPTAWQRYENQEVIHIKTRATSLMVTPDHRCLVFSQASPNKQVVRQARDYPNHSYLQRHGGTWEGGCGLPMSDNQIRLIVAMQADGHCPRRGVRFSFTKQRKVLRLQKLLDEEQIEYTFSIFNNGVSNFNVRCDWLRDYKIFDNWVFNMSRHQIDIFLDELFYWDGLFTRKCNYASAIKKNTDLVQALFCLSNKRARGRVYTSTGGSISHQLDIIHRRNDSFTSNRTITPMGTMDVYCCSVPSSFIVVRRDSCVMVTGQCQNLPSSGHGAKVRNCFLPDEGHVFVDADMDGAEIRIAADFSGEPLLVDALERGIDMHSQLASATYSVLAGEPVVISKSKTPMVVKGHRLIPGRVRDRHKSVTFSFFYLGGPNRIYTIIGDDVRKFRPLDVKEACKEIHTELGRQMPVLSAFLRAKVDEANVRGFLRGPKFGRIRYFSKDAYGDAANNDIQMSNAEAIKLAMIQMDKWLTETGYGRLVLNVHDQLVTSAKEEFAQIVAEKQKQVMADSLSYFLRNLKGSSSVKITKYWDK